MSATLPLFPLQLVVFPNEKLNLHIFEPRYKQLLNECKEEGTTFGIPPFIDKKMMNVGTELRLEKIEKVYPNGEMDVRTVGIGLFNINEVFNPFPGKLYIGAEVERYGSNLSGDFLKSEKIIEQVVQLYNMLAIPKDPPVDSATFSTYEVAHHIGLTLEQEYELLQLDNEMARQDYVLSHLQKMIPRVKKINNIRERALLNGHFRNIIPPEV